MGRHRVFTYFRLAAGLAFFATAAARASPPAVSSTVPANGATVVLLGNPLSATFSEAMNPAAINTLTFLLKQGNTAVTGTVTYAGVTATFTPASPLAPNVPFKATITAGVTDLAGNALVSNYVWSFTTSTAPFYTAASITQAAANIAEALAPNTIASLYGANLSYTTHAITTADLNNGGLPTTLEGVTVYVNGIQANLIYVSPAQINFLVPYEIATPSAMISVIRQGSTGPAVTIQLATTSPAFFEWSGNLAVAEHADGSVISADAPARPGEIVVLYAAGLGRTSPDQTGGIAPQSAATILYVSQLQILLNGVPCPPESIKYAGVTPGYAGLYQINVQLPATLPPNPEIQIAIGSQMSPQAVQLPVQ